MKLSGELIIGIKLSVVFGHFPKELCMQTLSGVKEGVKPGGYFVTEVYSHFQIPYNSGEPQKVQELV